MQAWLRELDQLKTQFGADPARRKQTLLESAQGRAAGNARDLLRLHEALCFIRAFPDNERVFALAGDALRSFAPRVRRFRKALVDSGIAGTTYHYPFGLPMARWLVERYGDFVDVDWDDFNQREEDNLSPLLPPTAGWTETLALDDEELATQDWFERTSATGTARNGALRRLVRRLHASGLPDETQEALYNGVNLPLRWELADTDASRTLAWIEEPNPYFHTEPLRGRTSDLRAEVRNELTKMPPVSLARGRLWIDLARRALSVREREMYALALANELEVYEADVGRGVRIILIGMLPDRRLPLDSNYAVFIVKNGMPISYGGGALLFGRVETAVNVFPTFRQGESSFLVEQLARVFHHQFGCDAFLVERYQLGHENDEGLAAGSFWFFYKLGFRPVDKEVARLAAKEAKRLKRERGSRTPRSLLKQLARSNVIAFLDDAQTAWTEIPHTAIGIEVTRLIESAFAGDARKAEAACAREVARVLGAQRLESWPDAERRAFERVSPMISLIPQVAEWSPAEKASLVEVLRAKGRTGEADYARQVMRHQQFRAALTELGPLAQATSKK
jgi:hypothetical protein